MPPPTLLSCMVLLADANDHGHIRNTMRDTYTAALSIAIGSMCPISTWLRRTVIDAYHTTALRLYTILPSPSFGLPVSNAPVRARLLENSPLSVARSLLVTVSALMLTSGSCSG